LRGLQNLRRRRARLNRSFTHVANVGGDFSGTDGSLSDVGAISRIIAPCVSIEAARSAAISDTLPIVVIISFIVSAVSDDEACIPGIWTLISSVVLRAFCMRPTSRLKVTGSQGDTVSLDVGLATPRLLSPGSPSAENHGRLGASTVCGSFSREGSRATAAPLSRLFLALADRRWRLLRDPARSEGDA
jgi:hypothetical protein